MKDYEIVYGMNPVKELLHSSRKIKKIFIKKSSQLNSRVLSLVYQAEIKNIKIKYISLQEIEQIAPGAVHQGVLAFVEKDMGTRGLDFSGNLYIMLDHITDTQNLGAVLRSAEYFKVDGIVLPKNRSADINATVRKASSGAVFYLNIIHVPNLAQTLEKFKNNNFWIVGADTRGDKNIFDFKFPEKSVLVAGNEEKGISPLIKKKLDYKLKIPQFGNMQSLNISVATGIFLFQYRAIHKIKN